MRRLIKLAPLIALASATISPLVAASSLPVEKVEESSRVSGARKAIAATVSGKVYNFSTERAKRYLGWSPRVSFERSLQDTLDELRKLR